MVMKVGINGTADYRLKWGAREEPTSAPWATVEEPVSS
jgi:hypothetical protein